MIASLILSFYREWNSRPDVYFNRLPGPKRSKYDSVFIGV